MARKIASARCGDRYAGGMHVTAEDLVAGLRGQGFRITKPRRVVCEVIAASHDDHLSAADVYERVRAGDSTGIDRSTVYRTLDTLEESGILRHGHLGHGPMVYHLVDDIRHHHLVCRNCGTVVSLPAADLADIIDSVIERTGFEPDLDHFALSGLCRKCADPDEP